VGCGKTTLCRRLLEELHPDYWDTALILNPRLSETDMTGLNFSSHPEC